MIVRLALPGDERVHEYAFDRAEAIIGSSQRTDLCVPVEGFPLRYARLRREDGRIWLEPLRPGMTLIIDRERVGRIRASGPIGLRAGDRVPLGEGERSAVLEFVSSGTDQEPPPPPATVFETGDEPLPPSPEASAALARFACALAEASDELAIHDALRALLASLAPDGEPGPSGIVILGTPRSHPAFVVDPELDLAARRAAGLATHRTRGAEVRAELAAQRALLIESYEPPLVLVPIPAPPIGDSDGPVAFWIVRREDHRDLAPLRALAGAASQLLRGALGRMEQARELAAMREEVRYFRERERRYYLFKDLVTDSPAMQRVYAQVREMVDEMSPVLILGEKGTGKEMIARALHHISERADTLMTSQNCLGPSEAELDAELFGRVSPTVPGVEPSAGRGLLELTRDGTLFLERIDGLSLRLQTKLVRTMREREVRPEGESSGRPVMCRLIVSSDLPLFELVEQGRFRKDLYLQLAEQTITVPPLRKRIEDIEPLANVFVQTLAGRYQKKALRVSDELGDRLRSYHWPGNVRELQGAIETGLIRAADDAEELESIPGI